MTSIDGSADEQLHTVMNVPMTCVSIAAPQEHWKNLPIENENFTAFFTKLPLAHTRCDGYVVE